jgi:hypothetical protein
VFRLSYETKLKANQLKIIKEVLGIIYLFKFIKKISNTSRIQTILSNLRFNRHAKKNNLLSTSTLASGRQSAVQSLKKMASL